MKTKYLVWAALGLMALGCTVQNTLTSGEFAREYLALWMDKYHPGISANSDGLYILQEQPGTGAEWDQEKTYSYIELTIRSLDGTVTSTTDETLSKQLGTYAKGNYYGPQYQLTGEGSSYAGLDALLKGMRTGGRRQAVIPAWMLTNSRYSTQQEYLDAATSTASYIYDVTLRGQSADVEASELDSLTRYVARHFGNVAPVSYVEDEDPDGTFYFISNASQFENKEDAVAREETSSATINYTGKLLNGQVFDTTVEKVAKDAGIYSASKTYSPVSITFASSWSDITMGESSSLINGFKGGLSLLKYEGEKAVVLFTSTHGYSTTGSGQTIPAWSPLLFELELVSVSKSE